MGRPAARAQDRAERAPLPHDDGSRPRRQVGPVPALPGGRRGVRLPSRPVRDRGIAHDRGRHAPRPRGQCPAGRGAGTARRLRLPLPAVHGLLHPAAAARQHGHHQRRRESRRPVRLHAARNGRRRAAVRLVQRPLPPRGVPALDLPFLRRATGRVLGAVHGQPGRRRDREGVLRLGERLQPVRDLRVLELHGGPVRQGAGQAPVRDHHGRRERGRDDGFRDHRVPGGVGRGRQPAAGVGGAAVRGDGLHRHAGALVARASARRGAAGGAAAGRRGPRRAGALLPRRLHAGS